MTNKRVLFVITEDWAVISHRLHLIDAAIKAGYKVGLATRISKHRKILQDRDIELFYWNIKRGSLNPFKEILTIFSLVKILWLFKPSIIHAVAQKPVIYSGLAKILYKRVSFVAALGGLGYIFTSKKFKALLLRPVIRIFLKLVLNGNKSRLILQNKDNINTIKKMKIIDDNLIRLVRGAGVETEKFLPSKIPSGKPIIILPGRMLWDKGVGEFVRVSSRIKAQKIKARFVLVGDVDSDNPESVSQHQIDKWVASGILEQWARCNNMEEVYKKCLVVCFPSYNEGLPKVLLEAGSSSRPVIAYDVPGCREIIINDVNGLLIELRNEKALESALVKLIKNRKLCEKMGKKGLEIVNKQFSSVIINNQTFNIWREVT